MRHSDLKKFIDGHRPLAERGEYFIFPNSFNREELEQLLGINDHGIRFSFTVETDGGLTSDRKKHLTDFINGDKLFWALPHDERDAELATWHEIGEDTPIEVLNHLIGSYDGVYRHFVYKTEVVEKVIGKHELNDGGKLIIKHNKTKGTIKFDVTTPTFINGYGNAEFSFTRAALEHMLEVMSK